jgi:hypothetical protein
LLDREEGKVRMRLTDENRKKLEAELHGLKEVLACVQGDLYRALAREEMA